MGSFQGNYINSLPLFSLFHLTLLILTIPSLFHFCHSSLFLRGRMSVVLCSCINKFNLIWASWFQQASFAWYKSSVNKYSSCGGCFLLCDPDLWHHCGVLTEEKQVFLMYINTAKTKQVIINNTEYWPLICVCCSPVVPSWRLTWASPSNSG